MGEIRGTKRERHHFRYKAGCVCIGVLRLGLVSLYRSKNAESMTQSRRKLHR